MFEEIVVAESAVAEGSVAIVEFLKSRNARVVEVGQHGFAHLLGDQTVVALGIADRSAPFRVEADGLPDGGRLRFWSCRCLLGSIFAAVFRYCCCSIGDFFAHFFGENPKSNGLKAPSGCPIPFDSASNFRVDALSSQLFLRQLAPVLALFAPYWSGWRAYP